MDCMQTVDPIGAADSDLSLSHSLKGCHMMVMIWICSQVWYQFWPTSGPTMTLDILCVLTSDRETGSSIMSPIDWYTERGHWHRWGGHGLKGLIHLKDKSMFVFTKILLHFVSLWLKVNCIVLCIMHIVMKQYIWQKCVIHMSHSTLPTFYFLPTPLELNTHGRVCISPTFQTRDRIPRIISQSKVQRRATVIWMCCIYIKHSK